MIQKLFTLMTPALVALWILFLSAHGPVWFISLTGVLLLLWVALSLYLLARHSSRPLRIIAAAAYLLPALLVTSYCASPFPVSTSYTLDSLPNASPPAGMDIFQLPTGSTHRSASFAYRGGSLFERREFSMIAALVKHPKGDILIDAGFGRDISTHIQTLPLFFRLLTSYTQLIPAAEQLRNAGYVLENLRGIILTHAHWDHVSGVADFPDTPLLLNQQELNFVAGEDFTTATARSIPMSRLEAYSFDDGPYLGFERSHDLYGDGAIVVVPAPGHTPGSVIVFVTLPDQRRFAFIGDLAWQQEGILQQEERPFLQRLADWDAAQVREALAHVAAIAARFPQVKIVVAHDPRSFADLPPFAR